MPTPTSNSPSLPPPEGSARPLTAPGGADGPFPVPSPHAASQGFLGAPVESGDAAGPPSFAWLCLAVRNCPDAGRELYATAQEAQHASDLHVAQVHGQTPPAARVSAGERPEAAGEPEAAGDGVAGYEAARGRRALTMREIRVALGHRVDFDGCNSECRKAQRHTFRWGGCEHAVKPEPTVSLSRIYTAPDGYPAIGFDRYTVAELAELIEPALHAVGIRFGPNALAILQGGHEVRLPAGEITRLALAAADAIVTHSNRDAT